MFIMSPHYGRVVHFRLLPTPCCHDAVAFGYRRVNFPPDGDFHPIVCTPSQAHERDVYAASTPEVPQAVKREEGLENLNAEAA